MDRATDNRASRRISRRALLGWGMGAGLAATGGLCYALARAQRLIPSSNITDLYTYTGHTQAVKALAWSPDGSRIASSSWDTTIQVWDSATGRRLLIYSGHWQAPISVSWSPDSAQLVSAGGEGSVQVWRAVDGYRLWIYQPQAGEDLQPQAAWSPDGARIATVGLITRLPDGTNATTLLLDAASGQRLLIYNDPSFPQRVAWAPDSARLASGGYDQSVTVWPAPRTNVAGQNSVAQSGYPTKIWGYRGDMAYVNGLAWSADGTRIASCGSKPIVLFASNGGVRIWNAATGQRELTYLGHSQSVDLWALAWSPDGRYIASGGTDQVVQVWNARTGEHLATYTGHVDQRTIPNSAYPYAITAISWAPDSARIASSASNGPVRVWKFSA